LSWDSWEIGSPAWLVPAVVVAVIIGLVSIWDYRHRLTAAWAIFALALKLIGIAILALCLIEPVGRGERPRPQANVMAVLVDDSQSMEMRSGGGTLRGDQQVRRTLDPEAVWLRRLEQIFDLRRFRFATRLDSVDDFQAIEFDGDASNLRLALEDLSDRFAGRPMAGVLLMTDGNLTDSLAGVDWKSLGFPVFPVVATDDNSPKDLRFGEVSVSETDFEASPITIDTTLIAEGLVGEEVTIRLLDAGDLIVQQHQVSLFDTPSIPVRFRFRPESSGVSFFRLECFLDDEASIFAGGESRIEATFANNTRIVAVNQQRGPYDVLYVAGRPNWDFKYLRRAIDQDAEVRLVGLLRLAKKQPKFSFRDSSIQSNTNPLFAGLGADEEEIAEQLDEPVVIPIGVKDANELPGGFPTDAATLFPYSAIVIDDLEASFFTQDQLMLLRRFVSTRGGAILMLGGNDALEKGGYTDNVLAELAPVYIDNAFNRDVPDGSTEPIGEAYKLKLTREGMLQPFLRLRSTEDAEAIRVRETPPLKVLNRVGRVKPGAVVLASAIDRSGIELPALVTQPFGRGKTAALMFGDLWRWSLQDGLAGRTSEGRDSEAIAAATEDDPAQVWRQMIRWLISDVPRRVAIAIEPTPIPTVVRLAIDVREEDFSPFDGADVTILITAPDSEAITLVAEPDAQRPGRYVSELWMRQPGGYVAQVTGTAPDGRSLGTDEIGWTSDPTHGEFDRLGTNRDLLQQIASDTGGELVPAAEIADFSQRLSSRPVPVSEVWVYPLWHRWWILTLAIGCLCCEWGLRRLRGMP
jgi:uncharacterized membrane protein